MPDSLTREAERLTLTLGRSGARLFACLLPVALWGWLTDADWVHVDIDTPLLRAALFLLALLYELYLLLCGVWPRRLVVDLNSQSLSISAACPLLQSPAFIPLEAIAKIRIAPASVGGRNDYGLLIETHAGKTHSFAYGIGRIRSEQWRDAIAEFAAIDNITRQRPRTEREE